jgi:hypothetical protein
VKENFMDRVQEMLLKGETRPVEFQWNEHKLTQEYTMEERRENSDPKVPEI